MSNKKILIAEDSSVIQNIAKKVLGFQGYDILIAKNGKEVLEKVQNENFDVILMDINIPHIDGMECAKQIRALSDVEKSKTPIIAVTGNANNYSKEDFEAVGINEYMPKPINFDLLIEYLKQLLA
ncbi:MAG: response regulator [Cytophagia bacterium]|nr:MAG: response regulator [Cytophagales bacterium]TAG06493.1 MAG: response regulator [Cytophagia bacterium]TAG44263.1 MAG: response regulator [Cytophagia bacterium]TAH30957.1 MAG: response regulator [Cytophagales bacterium]